MLYPCFFQNTKILSSTVRETGDCASDTHCPARCPGARAGTGGQRGARPIAVPSVGLGAESGPLRPLLQQGAHQSPAPPPGPAPRRARARWPRRCGSRARRDTAAPRRPGGRPGAHAGSGQGPEGALRRGAAPGRALARPRPGPARRAPRFHFLPATNAPQPPAPRRHPAAPRGRERGAPSAHAGGNRSLNKRNTLSLKFLLERSRSPDDI